MKALKKNIMGVSPVIAVILMVAITVVLAGVVFLWAQSFTGNEDTVTTIAVDLELESDSGAAVPSADNVLITPTKGEIDWSLHKLYFEGSEVVHSLSITTAAGETTTISVGGGTLTVGDEYNIRIVNIENDQVVIERDLVCKAI